jgi:hypothetical protein
MGIKPKVCYLDELGDIEIKDIVKHSKNIIDLIEVGDYVNGYRVKQINCKLEYIDDDSDTGVNEVDNGLEIEGYPTWIYFECEIESIVTKEQFASVEYVF